MIAKIKNFLKRILPLPAKHSLVQHKQLAKKQNVMERKIDALSTNALRNLESNSEESQSRYQCLISGISNIERDSKDSNEYIKGLLQDTNKRLDELNDAFNRLFGLNVIEKKSNREIEFDCMKWLHSYPPHIAKGFSDVPEFSFRYWLNMLEAWHKHKHTILDPFPCMDIFEEYLNIQKGQRHTVYQPKKSENMIYMLGSYISFGMYVIDRHTSASALQRRCENAYPGKYKVTNLGFVRKNLQLDFFKCYELLVKPGDFVFLQVDHSYFVSQMKKFQDLFVAINKKCRNNGAYFITLLIPSPGNIINPSELEKILASSTYENMLQGNNLSFIAHKRIVWSESPVLDELRRRGCIIEDFTPYFARPHSLGEIYLDKLHLMPGAYDEISRIIYDNYIYSCNDKVFESIALSNTEDESLQQFIDSEEFAFLTSQRLISHDRLLEARTILEKYYKNNPARRVLNMSLNLSLTIGDYEWSAEICEYLRHANISFTVQKLALLFSKKDIKGAFMLYKQPAFESPFVDAFGEIYIKDVNSVNLRGGKALIIIERSGPADELRFAKLHPMLSQMLSNCSLTIACDYRLFSLFQRSMPELAFFPVKTNKNLTAVNLSNYDQLPNPLLAINFDNALWKKAISSKSVIRNLDVLGDIIEGYETFDGISYLIADIEKVASMQKRLAHIDKPLVGICWRSCVVSTVRIGHYLSIDEISDIFDICDVQFVNLQSDVYSWEIERVNELYPGKLIHFSDIDQFNDFEATAALMKCMDLIISPATLVIELAGALGCPSWLFTNSAKHHWRKNPLTESRDVWHNSVEHIEGKIGRKDTLVAELVKRLSDWCIAYKEGSK